MLTLEQFKEARNVLQGVLRPTPLIHSPYLSKSCGNNVYLKPENMQVTGAYKIRGAYYKISTLTDEEKAKGLVTASAGVVFYLIARTSYMANRIAGSILLALILIGTALTAFLCAKNRGRLRLGGRTLRLFPDGFNPLLFYFICVLWAVVLIACLLFGSGFAFYAMFAAIAVELIGAVYYTFQLK